MYNQIERELKLLVNQEIYEKIIHSYDFSEPWEQINTYYDTEDGYIRKKGGALRIRQIGVKKIFTLKLRTDEITHIELEKEIDTVTIQEIQDEEVLSWINQFQIPMDVKKTVSFKTIRQTYDFENGQLCADQTIYENHMDFEIEYEYTKEHDGIQFFNDLLKPFHLEYKKNCPSKIARAL